MRESTKQLGIMLHDVKLLGTSLTLEIGQHVHLTPPLNLPCDDGWFARPADGKWADGIDHIDDSILIRLDAVDIILPDPEKKSGAKVAICSTCVFDHAIMEDMGYWEGGEAWNLGITHSMRTGHNIQFKRKSW